MKKWSLNGKIALVVVTLVIGSTLISALSLSQMGQINQALVEIAEVRVKSLGDTYKLRDIFYMQLLNERNFLLNRNPEARKAAKELSAKRDKEFIDLLSVRSGAASSEEMRHLADLGTVYKDWFTINSEIISLVDRGQDAEAEALLIAKGREIRLQAEGILEKLVAEDVKLMTNERAEAQIVYDTAKKMTGVLSLFTILMGSLLAFAIMRAASRAIAQVISDLNSSSSQVTQASRQIASASEELSGASTEQASSLEETVATLEELTSMVRVNTGNAQEASRLAESTQDVAIKGEQAIRSLTDSMGEISKDSKKIAEITAVVDDIAFQTNLLALNAAVEAARAGEQGKGFAVVAEAVRNLAQRSAAAAKDISSLIHASVEKVERGGAQATQSGKVLEDIVASVKKVAELNREIAVASAEQSNGIEQIGKAMNQLDQVTQVNAATSEEAAASAQELSNQAEQLMMAVGVLTETVQGARSQLRPSVEVATSSLKKVSLSIKPSKSKTITPDSVIPFESSDSSERQVKTVAGF